MLTIAEEMKILRGALFGMMPGLVLLRARENMRLELKRQSQKQMDIPQYYDRMDEIDIKEIIERNGFINGHGL